MNNQEAFDIIVKHLRTQNAQSMINGVCKYRDLEGKKCAVGCLIPDDMYDLQMEKCLVGELLNNWPELKKSLKDVDTGLLYAMQSIHDSVDISCWETYFANVASGFGLKLN